MSAPLLQTVKLIKLVQNCRFAGRVTSANQLRHFSDEKLNNGESIDDENISNNSLKLKLAETDDIPDQLKVAENESDEIKPPKAITSSYAKTFERLESLRTGIDSKPMPTESFATMLRHSKFIQLGDISGKVVVGKIAEIHGDDLYIDFGGKFYCVCQKPQSQEWKYTRGAKVKVHLQSLEMSSSFLGAEKHVTLLEADATLLGLVNEETQTRPEKKEAVLNLTEIW